MSLYFAYGSNMGRDQMHKRCPDHCRIGLGILKGYRWIITGRGYASVVRSVHDVVHGVVYEISDTDEKSLDHYEGVSSGSYRKERLSIDMSGTVVECLVYVDPREDEGLPGKEYIDRINRGITDAGLSTDYVERCIRPFLKDERPRSL